MRREAVSRVQYYSRFTRPEDKIEARGSTFIGAEAFHGIAGELNL